MTTRSTVRIHCIAGGQPGAGTAALLALALAACGGGAAGGRTGTVPPPPRITRSETAAAKDQPRREVSKDTRSDFEGAAQFFTTTDKARGWNESTCRQSADRFAAVVRAHPELVEAQFMVGVSYHRCGMLDDAERAYRQAIQIKPNHGASLSNLGEIYFRTGRVGEARQYWDSAIKANGKLIGARIGVASLELEQMRQIGNPKDADLEEARGGRPVQPVQRARRRHRQRRGLHGLRPGLHGGLAGQQEPARPRQAAARRGRQAQREVRAAAERLRPATTCTGRRSTRRCRRSTPRSRLDPKFVEARMNVGQVTAGVPQVRHRQATCSARRSSCRPRTTTPTSAWASRCAASRTSTAPRRSTRRPRDLDPQARRGLLQPRRALQGVPLVQGGLQSRSYKQAKEYFQQFLSAAQADQADKSEAKEQIALIDKTRPELHEVPAPASPPLPPRRPRVRSAGG